MDYTVLIVLLIITFVHLLGLLKVVRDAQRLEDRFSPFWLAAVVFVPVVGSLLYLVLKRSSKNK